MAGAEEQGAAAERPSDNGAVDGHVDDEVKTTEDATQANASNSADADAENNNKRKLDDEPEQEDDGPAKKKPVLEPTSGDALVREDVKAPAAGNEAAGGDPTSPAAVEVKKAPNTNTVQNGTQLADWRGQEVISCPRNMVGKLIGREGATIRDLQLRSGAKIQIDHSSEGSNKPMTLIGSPSEISLAKTLIKQALDPDSSAPVDVQRSLDCPAGIVGRVIGRGGETIRALQAATTAHIVVDQNFPEGQPRKIHITGKPEFVERAMKMVNEVIHGDAASVQAIIQKYGDTKVIECPRSIVGRIIGKGGETIKSVQKESNASIQIDQSSDPAKIQVLGKRPNVELAVSRLRAIINDEPYSGGQQFPPGGGYGQGMRPPFNAPGFNPPYPVAPQAYGGYGAYPQAGAAPQAYGYGYGAYPQYGAPQYGAYGSYGSAGVPQAASDPYAGGYGSAYQQPGAAGGYGSAGSAPAAASSGLWKEERDSEGRPYYYNTKTGVSQWEKPAEMA